MNTKKLLIISLIAIAILASVSAVSAGWLEDLFGGHQDNVIELDDMIFNTTNATNFVKFDKPSENEYVKISGYTSDNGTGHCILVIFDYADLYEIDNTVDELMINSIMDGLKDKSSQIVNGIIVYPSSPVYYDVGAKQMYTACVQNPETHKIIMLSSPDPNETAKMTSTLKFK